MRENQEDKQDRGAAPAVVHADTGELRREADNAKPTPGATAVSSAVPEAEVVESAVEAETVAAPTPPGTEKPEPVPSTAMQSEDYDSLDREEAAATAIQRVARQRLARAEVEAKRAASKLEAASTDAEKEAATTEVRSDGT